MHASVVAVAVAALLLHPTPPDAYTVLARGVVRVAVPPHDWAYVQWPHSSALTENLERCVEAHEIFTWRVLRPRPAPAVRFYIGYLGDTTLGSGRAGESAVSFCWPLFVENRSGHRVLVEIRYRLVRWQQYGLRI